MWPKEKSKLISCPEPRDKIKTKQVILSLLKHFSKLLTQVEWYYGSIQKKTSFYSCDETLTYSWFINKWSGKKRWKSKDLNVKNCLLKSPKWITWEFTLGSNHKDTNRVDNNYTRRRTVNLQTKEKTTFLELLYCCCQSGWRWSMSIVF